MKNIAAIDLGASSGRVFVAKYDGNKIRLELARRFPHNFVTVNNRAYWDYLMLFHEIKEGLAACSHIDSVGIDTWGADFALLDKQGHVLQNPRSYRDLRFSNDNVREAQAMLGGEKWIFENTHRPSHAVNTLYKLYAMKCDEDSALQSADKLLMLPNLFEYLLCGVKHTEYSIASTTQLFNMKNKHWAWPVIDKLGIGRELFTESVDLAGSNLGKVTEEVGKAIGHPNLNVISIAGHDTASAAAAVPSNKHEYTFLSSGTWSLMGICTKEVLCTPEIAVNMISNEGTHDGYYRPTISLEGLWLLQECRRNISKISRDYSFAELTEMAEKTDSCHSFIWVDDFKKSGNYIEKIQEYCRKTNQKVPNTIGEIVRCILESLAMRYRVAYAKLKPYIHWEEVLYMIGGGTQNHLLNQLTADALGIPVVCGSSEASTLGNVIVQLETAGEVRGRTQINDLLGNSFETKRFFPKNKDFFNDYYQKFLELPHNDSKT